MLCIPCNEFSQASISACMWPQGGFAAIDAALSTVDRKAVKGIGISGQQHGFVPMDGDGKVTALPPDDASPSASSALSAGMM